MPLYKEKDTAMKKAYQSYLGRLKDLPENKRNSNRMTWPQFKKNYAKTRAKTYEGGRTGSIEKGMRLGNALTYEEAKRFGGRG